MASQQRTHRDTHIAQHEHFEVTNAKDSPNGSSDFFQSRPLHRPSARQHHAGTTWHGGRERHHPGQARMLGCHIHTVERGRCMSQAPDGIPHISDGTFRCTAGLRVSFKCCLKDSIDSVRGSSCRSSLASDESRVPRLDQDRDACWVIHAFGRQQVKCAPPFVRSLGHEHRGWSLSCFPRRALSSLREVDCDGWERPLIALCRRLCVVGTRSREMGGVSVVRTKTLHSRT